MTTDTARDERLDGSTAIVGLVMLTVLILGFAGAANAADGQFAEQAWTFVVPAAVEPKAQML